MYRSDYFKQNIQNVEYYLAPFSIKKRTNIYGIIFGSSSIYGLEKFLKVCWDNDHKTGEANYSIENEGLWKGELSLFEQDNEFNKVKLFVKELNEFIQKENPDNKQIYRCALINGFSVTKANEILVEMQNKGEFVTYEIKTGKPARKRSFYLGFDHYSKEPRIKFKAK